jgi:hypothetical protein
MGRDEQGVDQKVADHHIAVRAEASRRLVHDRLDRQQQALEREPDLPDLIAGSEDLRHHATRVVSPLGEPLGPNVLDREAEPLAARSPRTPFDIRYHDPDLVARTSQAVRERHQRATVAFATPGLKTYFHVVVAFASVREARGRGDFRRFRVPAQEEVGSSSRTPPVERECQVPVAAAQEQWAVRSPPRRPRPVSKQCDRSHGDARRRHATISRGRRVCHNSHTRMSGWLTLLAAGALPHLSAARTPHAPTIDGRIDEAVWRAATPSDAFTQKRPDEGQKPSETTRVRMLYDDQAVYFAVECEQLAAPITARLTRRDREIEADWVSIAIDTRGDGRGAFEFVVNAASVLRDGIYYDDTEYSSDWDDIWSGRARRTANGWSAELRIPLRVLRFEPRNRPQWGLQVRRHIAARQEIDEWAFIPRAAKAEVSRYGRVQGLGRLTPGWPLEVRPFALVELSRPDREELRFAEGPKLRPSVGVDLKWHVTSGVTLDATINPDFGQVEADQAVLNLTNFETLRSEKRPFFLEGADVFKTPLPLFYTRRIGSAPAAPALPESEAATRSPRPAPIWAATKLVGQAGRVTLGQMMALTGPATVPARDGAGESVDRHAAPTTGYAALRAAVRVGQKSHVGVIATTATRLEASERYPLVDGRALCPSGELLAPASRCTHDAHVAAIDGTWRSSSGDWLISAQTAASLITGGPARSLRDGTVIGSGDAGAVGYLKIAKPGGEHWVGQVWYEGHSAKVDYNGVGYMQRQNQHAWRGEIAYRTLEPWKIFRETRTQLEVFDKETLHWLNLARGFQLNFGALFENFWGAFVELHWRPAHFDDREVGDGSALERAGLFGLELAVESDKRQPVTASAFTQTQWLSNGLAFYGEGQVLVHALPQLDIELLPQGSYLYGEPRYFGDAQGMYLFGRLRAASVGLTLRATYTFSPALTLQAYGQVFAAAGHFWNYSQFPRSAGAVVRLAELQPYGGALETNPDFSRGAFNANLVWRWEYQPGSLLYLVYSHAQDTSFAPALGDQGVLMPRLIKPRLAAEAFLVKLSYWWG